ncbi:PREDICTED: cyclin-D4-2-like [Ipomoea nil]|uniref:cyclin-D4-2-like n=1 Tax=Ipomoea nil TaxID=35883 RepID=UPI0009015B52|nr:PREDICTED: cyclin-D4-2-like [Ipomoea nil]
MADNSYDDPVASSLLCAETNSPWFNDSDSPAKDEAAAQESNGDKGLIFGGGRSEPLMEVPSLSEESFSFMVERESHHLPRDGYLKRLRGGDLELSLRTEAIDWIWKVHSHCGFGDTSLCLSISYLDRFLSMYEIAEAKSRNWAVQLLALGCLSLAAKMEEINVPLAADIQVGGYRFMFDGKTVQRMELLILTNLQWRMQAYTPCTFLDHFLRKINGDNKLPPPDLISKSIHIVLGTMKGIDFLEFRPSEVAAAVAMSVSGDTQTAGEVIFKAQVLHKERVLKCVDLIRDLRIAANLNVGRRRRRVPPSPNGVLEAACFSYKSDDPDTKRRRLDSPDTTDKKKKN